jgi:[ribosomal protein S5]-alanine N-acetyltransferase
VEQALHILNTIILPQYKNNLGRWAIHLKTTTEFIGWCGLKWMEAGASMYAFQQLHLKTIVGRAHIDNLPSLKILEKLGMQFICEEIVDDCPVKTYHISNPGL